MHRLLLSAVLASIPCAGCNHAPDTTSGPPEIGSGSPGSACSGSAETDTTECPYYACYCNEGGLDGCSDYCSGTICQDGNATCAYLCASRGGVDHIEAATHALCD